MAWSSEKNGHVLKCGTDASHEGITRHDKQREAKIARIKEGSYLDSKSLMAMPEDRMLARVEMAKFPQDLTLSEKRLLAQVAITYGFDPLMGEVSIYQGRPYVSIDGRYRKAQETKQLDGVNTRPATREERTDWQIPEGDYFFHAEVYVKGASHSFVGWGRVFGAETVGGKGFKPVEKNPQRMAEKRAEAQALRKAFHIPLPSREDIGTEEEDNHPGAIDVVVVRTVQKEANASTKAEISPLPDDLNFLSETPEQEAERDAEEKRQNTAASQSSTDLGINMIELAENMKVSKWSPTDAIKWLSTERKIKGLKVPKTVDGIVAQLTEEQRLDLFAYVKERAELSGAGRK